jgi:hypothetical protein
MRHPERLLGWHDQAAIGLEHVEPTALQKILGAIEIHDLETGCDD